MTAFIKTIKDKDGNIIVPRTRVEAIYYDDGTTPLPDILDIALLFKGTVNDFATLPSSNQKVGDMYYVTVDEVHYFWNRTAWAIVGSGSGGGTAAEVTIEDITNYYTSENVEGALDEIGENFETTVFYGDSVLTEPINTFAAVGEDILPSQDITYDLGSPSKRWKDLYLSGSSIHLGDTKLSIEEGSFTVADAATGDPISVDAATLEGHGASYFATSADITTAINNLVDSAPSTLNTLNELAAALGDDANYATTITTALSSKAPLESPTFTGTVSGITKVMVGLGNVDNTSDVNKPISTATQTALDGKLSLTGGTLTGALNGTSSTFTGTVKTNEVKLQSPNGLTEKAITIDNSGNSFLGSEQLNNKITKVLSSTNVIPKFSSDGNIENSGLIVNNNVGLMVNNIPSWVPNRTAGVVSSPSSYSATAISGWYLIGKISSGKSDATRYRHIKLSLASDNHMMYFFIEGYQYNIGNMDAKMGLYTYNGTVINTFITTNGNSATFYGNYRATDGSLVLIIDLLTGGYTEGMIRLYVQGFGDNYNYSTIQITSITSTDSTGAVY